MENKDFAEELDDELVGLINWENLFDELPQSNDLLPPHSDFSHSSPETVSSWIGEIENLLMNDDADIVDDAAPDFMADVLLDSPLQVSDKDSVDLKAKEEDCMSKKLKRQLRNRDAAVRSRERKKMHVKDLEMKSKFLEAECRRLGRLIDCLAAENHALRLAQSAAFGVSMTKQESAVLLLESLLLGSLLWFLAIICLFPLPPMRHSTLVESPIESGEQKAPQKLVPRGARSNMLASSRSCKASRIRMKWRLNFVSVLVSVFKLVCCTVRIAKRG